MSEISDLAAHCIRCGFCLESCPTFVVTGKETESPRGRIYLIRTIEEGFMPWGPGVDEHLDSCVGCRACETACPSGVEYGRLLELARTEQEQARPQWAKRLLLKSVTHAPTLRKQVALGNLLPGERIPGFVSKLLSGTQPEANMPSRQSEAPLPPLDESTLPEVKGEVSLLMGCAMDALYPRVHAATKRLLRRVGFMVREVQGCCGALHGHNGQLPTGEAMAANLYEKVARGVTPVQFVTNSAGCGSFLKEHPSAGVEVQDISEFLLRHGLIERLATAHGLQAKVTYHDACHLAHGQQIRQQPRELIKGVPGVEFSELGEADMCCGSGGIYNLTEPALARKLLDRKWGNVQATEAEMVVTGNPGCHGWIEQAAQEHGRKVQVLHTAEFLEAAFLES